MPVFEYIALNEKGKNVSGIMDAESASAARHKLRASRMYPVSIHETDKVQEKKGSRSVSLSGIFNRVRPVETAMMTRQLSTLVGAGFPLVSAIDTLIPQTRNHRFKTSLAQIKDTVVEGNSFAAALALFPKIFSPLYINMVSAGEASGTLEIVLDRLAEIMEKQEQLKNKLRSAMAYPILMTFIGAAVLFFLLTHIVPTISAIFQDMNQVLPAPTRFLIMLSDFLKHYWWILLMAAAGGIMGVRSLNNTKKGRYFFDHMFLAFPGFGGLIRKLATARLGRTLGSLLANGVTLLTALDIVKNIVGNVHMADTIASASQSVGKGQGLGDALSISGVFPSLFIQMIQVGEQTGELEPMLEKIADVYEREVESTVMSLTSLLEPLMILVMGVLVGFIVLCICLPIFEMNQLIR